MESKIEWLTGSVCAVEERDTERALAHQNNLTKPLGSLGQLESIAVSFCGWQRVLHPVLERVSVRVFAGDHGVCTHGVSAFPQAVTAQMIANFVHGGAAISVLSKHMNADFKVVNLGTVGDIEPSLLENDCLVHQPISNQTSDFLSTNAMSNDQLIAALNAGKEQVDAIDAHIFLGGEMGIGNTTSAAAIYCALLGCSPEEICGPGTGLDTSGVKHKQNIVQQALDYHHAHTSTAISILQAFGGFEIAALCASYLRCAQKGIPVLVDGYICTAAALLAIKINPDVVLWLLFAHQSDEPAHQRILSEMGAQPILDLGLRLGEGSGAALAVPVIQSALTLHNNMATFSNAGVSEKE